MRVVLFRHGPAGARDATSWPDDALRPLTSKGEERTRLSALGLLRLIGADNVEFVTSPFARCLLSAQILGEAFSNAPLEPSAALQPGATYRRILKLLNERKQSHTVVLVGHEPDLGKLAGILIFGAPSPLPLRKAGACLIDFVGPVEPGAGKLQWFLPPRALGRLAKRKAHA